jgi:AraC-like DNA-binding protein
MSKVVFSTDQLPAELDDHARFSRWVEHISDLYGAFDQSRLEDCAFSARFEAAQYGGLLSGKFTGMVNKAVRSPRHVAGDTRDDFAISFNRGRGAVRQFQNDQETILSPGRAMFLGNRVSSGMDAETRLELMTVSVPRKLMSQIIAHPDDLLFKPLDQDSPALRHLARYLDMIHDGEGAGGDPALAAHIETTLLDLVALVLGTQRDIANVASNRGLRAARLQEVLAAIKKGFSDPAFSSDDAASAVGVSRRYVNDLLYETGATLAERVLELRLQKARAMLASARHDTTKINDIAFACGFNEVSYFHRCFRRRFGAAPNEFRGTRRQAE